MLENRQRVKTMMEQPLPTLTQQKRLLYRPNQREVVRTYNLLNDAIFDNKLSRPDIELRRMTDSWGMCHGDYLDNDSPICLKIRLSDKFYTKQWFITTLAHEMAHQWQWEIQGQKRTRNGLEALMNHRACFFVHKKRMASMGISLKSWHRMRKWFKTQDLFRC